MNFGWWYVGGWWVPLCFAIIASKWYIDSEEKMLYSSVVPPFHQHSRDYCRHWEGSRFEPGVGGGKLCMFASERYERSAVVGGLFITSAHCLGSLNFTCVLHHSICFCNIYIYILCGCRHAKCSRLVFFELIENLYLDILWQSKLVKERRSLQYW